MCCVGVVWTWCCVKVEYCLDVGCCVKVGTCLVVGVWGYRVVVSLNGGVRHQEECGYQHATQTDNKTYPVMTRETAINKANKMKRTPSKICTGRNKRKQFLQHFDSAFANRPSLRLINLSSSSNLHSFERRFDDDFRLPVHLSFSELI